MRLKRFLPLLVLTLAFGCDNKSETSVTPPPNTPPVAAVDGIGIAIVVDHSGSMHDSVPDGTGTGEKEVIARRSVMSVIQRCEKFAKDNPNRKLQIAVFEFDDTVSTIVPFGVPSVSTAKAEVDKIEPNGSTAIGDAVRTAKLELDKTGLTQKHIIVVTDGENTAGAEPAEIAKNLNALLTGQKPSVYVIAFDVNSNVFSDVKKAGWTVLSASDASQLQQNLDTVLGDNILLEK